MAHVSLGLKAQNALEQDSNDGDGHIVSLDLVRPGLGDRARPGRQVGVKRLVKRLAMGQIRPITIVTPN